MTQELANIITSGIFIVIFCAAAYWDSVKNDTSPLSVVSSIAAVICFIWFFISVICLISTLPSAKPSKPTAYTTKEQDLIKKESEFNKQVLELLEVTHDQKTRDAIFLVVKLNNKVNYYRKLGRN